MQEAEKKKKNTSSSSSSSSKKQQSKSKSQSEGDGDGKGKEITKTYMDEIVEYLNAHKGMVGIIYVLSRQEAGTR